MAPSTTPAPENAKRGGLKVIHAGYMRTGTASMAEAYRILGYRTHHSLDDFLASPWAELEKAAEAKFPSLAKLPDYTYGDGSAPRPPLHREDWDHAWDGYDVVTDVAAPFALELIEAYPEAKVVVVQRPFETWWPSIREALLAPTFGPLVPLQNFVLWNIMGSRVIFAMRKIHAGFFGAPGFSPEGISEAGARRVYEEYYERIREAVPLESGRRLDYTLGDGWEPLCEFLGSEVVPDRAFPRKNDRAGFAESKSAINRRLAMTALRYLPVLAVPVAVVLFFVYR